MDESSTLQHAKKPSNADAALVQPQVALRLGRRRQMRQIDRLLDMVEEMGLSIEWDDLGPTRRGDYCDASGRIRISSRLRLFQIPSTLSHEIAHAAFRDRRSTVWTEARARTYAAFLAESPAAILDARGQACGRIARRHENDEIIRSSIELQLTKELCW